MSSRLRIIALAVAVLLLIGLGLLPRVAARSLRARISAQAARYGARAEVGAVRFGLSRIELYGLRVDGAGPDPLLYVRRVRVEVSLARLLIGRMQVDRVLFEEPSVFLVRGGPADNVSALVEAYEKRSAQGGGGGGGGLKIVEVAIASGHLELRDQPRGRFTVEQLDAVLRPDDRVTVDLRDAKVSSHIGATAEIAELHLESGIAGRRLVGLPRVTVKGGALLPFAGLRLGAIAGEIAPDESSPGRAKIDLVGSFADREQPLWSARGWIDPEAQQGRLALVAERFRLGQLSTVMGGSRQGAVDTKGAEVDVKLELGYASEVFDVGGRVHLSGLTISNARLGPRPLHNVGFDAQIDGRVDRANKTLALKQLKIDYRGVHALLVADVTKMGKLPSFHATATIEPVPCQRVFEALPAELTPFLQGFSVTGTFSTDLHAGLDLSDLLAPVDLGGKVGIEGCRVTASPAWANADRLSRSFEHTVEFEPGKWMTFIAGPENPDFVPYAEISPHLVNSIMTTEDSGFFKHRGFIPSEFRSALQQNLQRGYFRLGASSITMQMVKNVLLSREKTLSRKLQEMFITWYLEHHLSKERILEIYFNVIEFGPGIYGIGRAAHHYFGHSAHELTPRESAYFSSILPNPKRRYVQFCHGNGQVDAKWDTYLKRILRRMHERGRLTTPEYQEAIAQPLSFSRAEAVSERECMAIVKRTTGGPPWPSAR